MEGANVVRSHDDHQKLVLGGCYACRLTGVIFAEFTEITQLTKPQIPPYSGISIPDALDLLSLIAKHHCRQSCR